MNIGTTISFIIAGLILLAILNVNTSLMTDSGTATLDQSAKEQVDAVASVLSNDMRKIGYRVNVSSDTAIVSASQHSITFKSDWNNDGSVDRITWTFDTSKPVTSTDNPNDYELIRTVNGVSTVLNMGVTQFNITLYDNSGNVVASPILAKRIKVSIICETPESYNGHYSPASWQKIFTPVNIN